MKVDNVLSGVKSIGDVIKTKTERFKKEKERELKKIEEMELFSLKEKTKILGQKKQLKNNLNLVFRSSLLVLLTAYIGFLLFKSLELVYTIITAFIISMAMESMIVFFQKKIGRTGAIVFSYFIIIFFLILGFVVIVPFIIDQSVLILQIILDKFTNIQEMLQQDGFGALINNMSYLPSTTKEFLLQSIENKESLYLVQEALQENLSNIISISSTYIKKSGNIALQVLTTFFSGIYRTGMIFLLAILFSLDKEGIVSFMGFVSGKQDKAKVKIEKLYKKLGFWLQSNFIRSVFVWISLMLGLYSLMIFGIDLPDKASLILVAGITEFIPIIGPILGAVPAILVASTSYGITGIFVVGIIYLVIQWAENAILMPIVMNQALGVKPSVMFLAMFIGGSVLGVFGVILSLPIAVIATFIYDDMIKDRN